jgi:uncharacterized membrane protein
MKYPIKLNLKSEIMPMLILAAAVFFGFYFYYNYPEKVAAHWNFAGQVDRYSGKFEGAFAIPIMLVVMYVIFLVLPLLDPKKERYAEFEKYYRFFRSAILGTLFGVYIATGLFNLGYPIEIRKIVPFCIGALFIVIGKFMGKIKSNWFIGIRTPWTMSSENVWNKTHRVGGWLFVFYGLIMMVMPYLPETIGLGLFIFGTTTIVFGTFGYSYWLYRKEQDK